MFLDGDKDIKPIFENAPMADLSRADYKNTMIFYTDIARLTAILIEIVAIHGCIPRKIKYQVMSTTRI